MGHHLGHAGVFFLMLALIARPIRFLWDLPLKYRRTIGIFAFAAALGHAIYATVNILHSNWGTIFLMFPKLQWGMWAGILSLAAMTPPAITSFNYFKQKLGKNCRTSLLWGNSDRNYSSPTCLYDVTCGNISVAYAKKDLLVSIGIEWFGNSSSVAKIQTDRKTL